MAQMTTHNHDLEDHIEELRKLDELRRLSGDLRNEGIEVLKAHKNDLLRSQNKIFDVSLAIRALSTKLNLPFEKEDEQRELLKTIFKLVKYLQTLTLKDIATDKLSVLAAARVLRALAACPGAAFSRAGMVCYYWIIREFYTAEGSDWNTGGVRAATEGTVSAFVTGECVHALLSFAEAQQKTGIFIKEIREFIDRREQLDQLKNDFNFLSHWVKIEEQRLRLSFSLTIQRLSRHLVLPIDLPSPNAPYGGSTDRIDSDKFDKFAEHYVKFFTTKDKMPEELEKFADKFLIDHLKSNIEHAVTEFSRAMDEINNYRKDEENNNHNRAFMKSESAHLIAFSAVETAVNRVKDSIAYFDKEPDNKKRFEDCQKKLNKAAEEVQNLLRPAENYLGTVLDRELATVSLDEQWDWQPAELVCAATAYGRLNCLPEKWEKDARFRRATDHLSKAISHCGLIPNKRPYHIMRHANLHYYLRNSAALTALAHLLRNVTEPAIEPDLINKIIRFFEETRATQPYEDWWFNKEEIRKKEKAGNGDEELSAIEKYNFILRDYQKSPIQVDSIKNMFPLEEAAAEKKEITDGLWGGVVTLLNQILKDEKFYKNYVFSEKDKYKDHKEEAKKLKEELSKKDNGRLVRLNRLILEDKYQDIILKSGAVKFSSDKPKTGWCREYSPLISRKTDLTATAHAVFALAEINEMLDTRINHMILDHFSVKEKNKGLNDNLTLTSLFYPDYGLSSLAPEKTAFKTKRPLYIEEKDWPKKGIGIKREESVAITLQQMRAHVSRVGLPDKDKPLCSLVLHGPAGTGKTTLVEALAVTCEVPLVEVTPSDLVKRGEENLEQRARAVFYALSLLTRAVILFDEFDPVLKRRDINNNGPINVFSFLTPGMLPKLKDLHDRAEKRSVSYVLVTNLVGELDEAAVRQGRFDKRLGIYPPDLLSRSGRFCDQIHEDFKEKPVPWTGVVPIIKQTEGKGMTTLGKLGWFTIPDNKRKELKEKLHAPYHLLFLEGQNQNGTRIDEFVWPDPDDVIKGILGKGKTAVKECLEWMWINEWDKELSKKAVTIDELTAAVENGASLTKLRQPQFAQNSRRRGDQLNE